MVKVDRTLVAPQRYHVNERSPFMISGDRVPPMTSIVSNSFALVLVCYEKPRYQVLGRINRRGDLTLCHGPTA